MKRALRHCDGRRAQHALIHRIASTELFTGHRHGPLIGRRRDVGKGGGVALDVQLHGRGRVIEAGADEQVIRYNAGELPLHPACGLQDLILTAEHAACLWLGQDVRVVFQRQRHNTAIEHGFATHEQAVTVGCG